jgi:hypothetical protein
LGIFSSGGKFLIVKPVFKTGDRFNIAQCRPISLLTSFSKVFEKIVYSSIYQYMVQNQILAKEQYGFSNRSSIVSASYTLILKIFTATNNKHIVGGIFCDLKEFDCINYGI